MPRLTDDEIKRLTIKTDVKYFAECSWACRDIKSLLSEVKALRKVYEKALIFKNHRNWKAIGPLMSSELRNLLESIEEYENE